MLAAPLANFEMELRRLNIPAPPFHAFSFTNNPVAETAQADLADLLDALDRLPSPPADPGRILQGYAAETAKLAKYRVAADERHRLGPAQQDEHDGVIAMVGMYEAPKPVFADFGIRVPDGLPAEFEQYFRGAIAWYSGDTNGARTFWDALLNLPASERHFRSVRAAYMLGRSWEDEDASKATQYYQKAQRFGASGFADPFGKASAALGWEARLVLRKGDFARAIDMYLDHMAAGDNTAVNSLRFVAMQALDTETNGLTPLASNPRTRHVINSYLISSHGYYSFAEDPLKTRLARWLEAMESAGVHDDESAVQVALAAYDAGQWETAQRWINRARSTPVTQWLEAKLLLRAGKLDDAAELLSSVVQNFPITPDTNNPSPLELKDSLYMRGSNYLTNDPPGAAQALGELGILRLSRREYSESLDALLRSGFWMDAAYVAERVLTADELKSYVDHHWPPPKAETNDTNTITGWNPIEIRYLLARRLARLERFAEAREYFPEQWQNNFDELVQNLKSGRDDSSPADQRAHALFAAAKITRTNGMELLGTEVEPDWHIEDGDFAETPTANLRTTNELAQLTPASEDETGRTHDASAQPNERFHYRYQAAALGWEAAKLMPDNSDETARVLCTAGSWLKFIDPDKADAFYKSLVRRCRKTAIGDQADRMRWFPLLDELGNPVPWKPQPLQCSEWTTRETEAGAEGGYWYIVTKGNSWRDIVEDVQLNRNVPISVKALREANHSDSASLPVGAKIFVPAAPPGTTDSSIRK